MLTRHDAAINRLIHFWTMFGRLIARTTIHLDDKKSTTACTDGINNIWVNPEFADNISVDELCVLYCHEVLHIILHTTRGTPKSIRHYVWNIAEDIVINSMILQQLETGKSRLSTIDLTSKFFTESLWPINNSIKVKGFGPIDLSEPSLKAVSIEDVSSKTVADIYRELMKYVPDEEHIVLHGKQPIDSHDSIVDLDSLDDEDRIKTRERWEQAVMIEVEACRLSKGDIPAGFENIVKDIREPRISWRTQLCSALTSSIISDTSYTKFSRRSVTLRTPLPGYVKTGLSLLVHIDTSGSTSRYLSEFFSELRGILRTSGRSAVKILQCDSDIQSVEEVSTEQELKFEAKGFGGTSHKPVIDYVNNMAEPPKILISFTDGYSDIPVTYPKLRQGIKSIFVVPDDGQKSSGIVSAIRDYGTVIVMDKEDMPG